jgi:2-polyprenyl-6-methoxyphenol hydroxylase-like FAD-dependent oxidoreductase
MATQPGRVLIVGAGPAGMALAYLLARRGVDVTVLEAHHDFARAFRGEGLQLSGIDAFRQMGLGEKFDAVPYIEAKMVEIYFGGKLILRADPAELGRAQARIVSQPAVLQLLADEAGKQASFRLERGVSMRDFLRENGRVVGVRATVNGETREYRADLVIGADGRNAATRKHSGLTDLSTPQDYDLIWLKVPYPKDYPDRSTGVFEMAPKRAALAFPTADGQLQVGFVIPKGGYAEIRSRGTKAWLDELIGRLPAYLAEHLRAHRDALSDSTVLNVVCGRLEKWSTPGLLLIGDAAHPMSPVGGQGVNIALRDALVAANHLVPVLTVGANPAEIDVATQQIQDERWPEIVTVQKMQEHQAKMLFVPDGWKTRLLQWLLPLLLRTGLLQRMNRKEYKLMSEGAVPVKLVV